MWGAWNHGGRAGGLDPRPGLCTIGIAVQVPFDVVADVEIQETVAVHISPGTTGPPVRVPQPGLAGDIDKAAPAPAVRFVVIQYDLAKVGDDQVVVAVV